MNHHPHNRFGNHLLDGAVEFVLNLIGEAVSSLLEGLFNL